MSDDDLPVSRGRRQSLVQPGLHRRVVVHLVVVGFRVDDDEVYRMVAADRLDVIVPQVRLVPAPLVLRQLHLHKYTSEA